MIDIGIREHPEDSGCLVWYYKDEDDKLFFNVPNRVSDEIITTATRITNLVKTRTYMEFSVDQITHETLHKVVNGINEESSIIDKLQNDGVIP